MRLAVRQNLPFWVTLLFILGLALFTRLYQLGTAPQGITWDEAALGYVGRMVVTTTRDEYGQRLPITFTSFGDYKSPLAFYFTGLSTTLFGLSPWAVRLPFALAGIGSILLMMWLVWRLWRERWIAALAGFLMITMPWHFLFSRIGFEVGVVLLFLLLVLAAWVELHLLPDRTPRWRPLALTGLMVTGVVAGLYTYHAAKLVFPMVLVSMFAHDVLHHRQWLKNRWQLILGLVVATGVLSVPLLLDIFHGPGIERATQTSFVGTLPWWPTLVQMSQNLGAHLNLQFSCLRSIASLADELLIMDMGSTDDTLKIAKQFKAKILTHPDVGYADPARNQALAAATKDWILVVDSDEEVPPALAKKIPQLINDPGETVAFAFARYNLMFGQWAQTGWWPDYQRRLFKRGQVDWPPQLHGQPQIKGPLRKLPAEPSLAILHHNYAHVDDFIDRAQRYSTIAATQIKNHQAPPATSLIGVWLQEFLQRWFVHEGYRQTHLGQTLSYLQSSFEAFTLAKHWEDQEFSHLEPLPKLSTELAQAAKQARYWEAQAQFQNTRGLARLYWRLRRRFQV